MNEVRPQTFNDVIGQDVTKEILSLRVSAFKKTNECSGHMLFLGNAGLGKSTLALCTANEMGVNLHVVFGTRINKWEDLLKHLLKLKQNDILFIDEIHDLPNKVQEELLGIIEDFQIEVMKYGEPAMYPLPRFTLIGATTHAGLLTTALRRRFPLEIVLKPYSQDQLSEIIKKAAYKMCGFRSFSDAITKKLARLSKGNASHSINLLKNLIEIANGSISGTLSEKDMDIALVDKLLKLQGLDPILGLNRTARQYLTVLATESRPFGIGALANILNEQPSTITGVIEPFLSGNLIDTNYPIGMNDNHLQGPFVKITRMGRQITDSGRKYLELCCTLQRMGWMEDEKINFESEF